MLPPFLTELNKRNWFGINGACCEFVFSSLSSSFSLKCNKQWMKIYLKLSGRSVTRNEKEIKKYFLPPLSTFTLEHMKSVRRSFLSYRFVQTLINLLKSHFDFISTSSFPSFLCVLFLPSQLSPTCGFFYSLRAKFFA